MAVSCSSPQFSLNSVSRLKTALAKRTGRPEVELQGPEEGLGRRRSSRIMEETSGMEEEEEEETAAAVHGRRGRRDGEVLAQTKESGRWKTFFLLNLMIPFFSVSLVSSPG